MFFLFDGASLQNKRKSNMDSLFVQEKIIDENGILLAVVCDGVGSMLDGGYAASEVIKGVSKWFSGISSMECIDLRLRDEILAINDEIVLQADRDHLNTACTLSALLILEDNYFIAHVGDSRIYAVQKGALQQLTPDDVSESGGLTACLGHGFNPIVFCAQGRVDGRLFLLCSDGLYKRMDNQFLLSQLSGISSRGDLTRKIGKLTEFVIGRGECDNISLIVVKINDGGKSK